MMVERGFIPIRVFISYSHDNKSHIKKVLDFSNKLRADGIDSYLDQYELFPKQGWPLWMLKQIELAHYVLIICTKKYKERAETDNPKEGFGAIWESKIIRQCLYNSGGINIKFIPLIFNTDDIEYIPLILQGYSYYNPKTKQGYASLYQCILNAASISKTKLGTLKPLPKITIKQDFKNLIWNIPYPRNTFFTGREEILQEIRLRLNSNNSVAITHVLRAMGGMGKTQISLEYAYRYRDKYAAVFWVVADTEYSLNSSYLEIATLLMLEEANASNQNVIVNSVKKWLEDNGQWLIIYDNADSPQILKKYLPNSPKGQVIITSRAQNFDMLGILKHLEIDAMTSNEAIKFLQLRVGRFDVNLQETDNICQLVTELGCLPLALEQAGAFISLNQISFTDYLISYRKRHIELLETGKVVATEYTKTIATTWSINFQEIRKKSVSSEELLIISSFLSPDNIPIEFFVIGSSELGENLSKELTGKDNDPVIINMLLAPLTEYSLIRKDIDSNSFNIHRLVQEVLKSTLSNEYKRKWALVVCRSMNKIFPSGSYSTWSLCERLLTHAIVCAKLTSDFNFTFADSGEFINGVACYLRMRSDFKDSERHHLQSLHIRERDLGLDSLEVAECVNNLALVYTDQYNYSPAEPLLIRCLQIHEIFYGKNNPNLTFDYNQLGFLYVKWGRFTEAKEFLEKALAFVHDSPDYHDFFYAIILNNTAELYLGLKDYDLAEKFCLEGLVIRENIDNPEKTWRSYNTLGAIYLKQNNFELSFSFLIKALDTAEHVFGKIHPELIIILNRLIELKAEYKNSTIPEDIEDRLNLIKTKYQIAV